MEENLINFIEIELEKKGWTWYELGRQAGISTGTIYNIRSGFRGVGKSSLSKIAKALNVPTEKLYRLGGLLPDIPENSEYEQDLLYLVRQMDTNQKISLLEYAKFQLK